MTWKTAKELGNALSVSSIRLHVPAYPEEKVPCPCGQTADYLPMPPRHVNTLQGTVPLSQPCYLCQSCHHGLAPSTSKQIMHGTLRRNSRGWNPIQKAQ